jgi:hypothetical protein
MRYTAEPLEVSLVDHPCLPEATFTVIKLDGSTELASSRRHQATPARAPAPSAKSARRIPGWTRIGSNESTIC